MSNNPGWVYTEKVKQHFLNPQNVLNVSEEEYKPDGVGIVGSSACGDMMVIFIKVKDDRIYDLKWKTYGCASAIASTSVLSVLVTKNGGMKLEDAYKIKPEDIVRELDELPSNKIHCSVLGDKALRAAIDDYFKKQNLENPCSKDFASPIICECNNVTEDDIKLEVLDGNMNFETLQQRTKVGTTCGKCIDQAKAVMQKYIDEFYSSPTFKGK
jgi:NifU-like protein involved in Fe-S cluster formation/bacterioferritin-associated ferredoxin